MYLKKFYLFLFHKKKNITYFSLESIVLHYIFQSKKAHRLLIYLVLTQYPQCNFFCYLNKSSIHKTFNFHLRIKNKNKIKEMLNI